MSIQDFLLLKLPATYPIETNKIGWLSTLEASGVAKGGSLWSFRPHSHRADVWKAAVSCKSGKMAPVGEKRYCDW